MSYHKFLTMNLLAPQFRRPCCTTKAQWHALDFSRRKRPCDLGYGLRKKKIVTIKKYRKSVQSFDPYWMKTLLSLGSYIVEENRKGMIFCYQNFSDLLTVRKKKCSSDREKLLKFEAEGREFAKVLTSLEQFVWTVKGQNNFW